MAWPADFDLVDTPSSVNSAISFRSPNKPRSCTPYKAPVGCVTEGASLSLDPGSALTNSTADGAKPNSGG
jgi:hypothetical protein